MGPLWLDTRTDGARADSRTAAIGVSVWASIVFYTLARRRLDAADGGLSVGNRDDLAERLEHAVRDRPLDG